MYNGHADVTALVDGTGAVQATYYYDAFGNITQQTGTVNNNITYSGYQYDKESGLYYLNSRYYDPVIARFLSEDTFLGDRNDPLSLNLYTYCHNEPLMYSDPTGHVNVYGNSVDLANAQSTLGNSGYTYINTSSSSWNGTVQSGSIVVGGTGAIGGVGANINTSGSIRLSGSDRYATTSAIQSYKSTSSIVRNVAGSSNSRVISTLAGIMGYNIYAKEKKLTEEEEEEIANQLVLNYIVENVYSGGKWNSNKYKIASTDESFAMKVAWDDRVHYTKTKDIAIGLEFYEPYAEILAKADNDTDSILISPDTSPFNMTNTAQSWHFDRDQDPNIDSRQVHANFNLAVSIQMWKEADEIYDYHNGSEEVLKYREERRAQAFTVLGRGLHALQDKDAHMDWGSDDYNTPLGPGRAHRDCYGSTDTFDDPSYDFEIRKASFPDDNYLNTTNDGYVYKPNYQGVRINENGQKDIYTSNRYYNTERATINYLQTWQSVIYK